MSILNACAQSFQAKTAGLSLPYGESATNFRQNPQKANNVFTRLDDSSADDEAHHLTAYWQNDSDEVPHTAQSQRNFINSRSESVDSLECGNTGLHSQAKSLPGFQRSPFQTSDTHPHHTGHHYIRDVLLLLPNTAF